MMESRMIAPSNHPYAHPLRNRRRNRRVGQSAGQSLVEFILVMPILILTLAAGGMIGVGTYQAHMASNAIQQPAREKLQFSQTRNAILPANLQTGINQGGLQGSLIKGPLLDQLQVTDSDPYTSLMVGSKNFQASMPFLPSFRITVTQVINRNLLLPANGGAATVRPSAAPWVPNGVPTPPPW